MKRRFQSIGRGIMSLSRMLNLVGVSFLVILMLLTTADVAGRYFFNNPLSGALELSEYFMAVVIMLGLAYTASVRGHIKIELLISHWPPRVQAALDSIGCLIGAVVAALIVWQGALGALDSLRVGLVSDILAVPAFPFHFLIPLGAFVLCLVLIVQFFESLDKARKSGSEVKCPPP